MEIRDCFSEEVQRHKQADRKLVRLSFMPRLYPAIGIPATCATSVCRVVNNAIADKVAMVDIVPEFMRRRKSASNLRMPLINDDSIHVIDARNHSGVFIRQLLFSVIDS